jgi:2-polyprenyl-3-methyl-5-hydroxy-6-metoxy-1,4-benzoquinol methylase
MEDSISQWNKLSKEFDTKNKELISANVADNILIAYPPIIDLIKKHFYQPNGLSALDYGCGAGDFCNKLLSFGFNVTGVDFSPEMIKVARQNSKAKFILGGIEKILELNDFDLTTSIMVFQFIENINELLKTLTKKLEKGGLLIFAVHNPEYVSNCLKHQIRFGHFDSDENPKKGIIKVNKGESIPIYVRRAEEYNKILSAFGFKKIMEQYPPFNKDFLQKYTKDGPTDKPEFMILGYSR